jgi:hypothetical protein
VAPEERKIPPLSFVAQKLRDDHRLAELRGNDGRPLFSSTARLVVLMLASFVNRRTFDAWPSKATLAEACGLDERSLRRYRSRHRQAIRVFFIFEERDGCLTNYTLKSPDEYEADLFDPSTDPDDTPDTSPARTKRPGLKPGGVLSATPDVLTDTPVVLTDTPDSLTGNVGRNALQTREEPEKEQLNEPVNRTLPPRGSGVLPSMPLEDASETVGKQVAPSMTPVMFGERIGFLKSQALKLGVGDAN